MAETEIKKGAIIPLFDGQGEIEIREITEDHSPIYEAARVSSGKDKEPFTPERNRILVHDLVAKFDRMHTVPFEKANYKFRITAPISIAIHLMSGIRFCSISEISGRYRHFDDRFLLTERTKGLESLFGEVIELHQELKSAGVASELARIALPLALMTEFYLDINSHALFKFLAEDELIKPDKYCQEVNKVLRTIVKSTIPWAYEGFEERLQTAKQDPNFLSQTRFASYHQLNLSRFSFPRKPSGREVLDHGYVNMTYPTDAKRLMPPETIPMLASPMVIYGMIRPLMEYSFTFEVECPIFVFRQTERHREGNLNFKGLTGKCYIPHRLRIPDPKNRQGSYIPEKPLEGEPRLLSQIETKTARLLRESQKLSQEFPEEARLVAPLNAYVSHLHYFNGDGLVNFLNLRLPGSVQGETRQFAIAMSDLAYNGQPLQ